MRKTILLCSNSYFPNIGGVENSLRYLALAYKKLGYDVVIQISDVGVDSHVGPTRDVDGIKVYRYPTRVLASKLLRPLNFFICIAKQVKQLRALQREYQFERVIARHHVSAALVAAVLSTPVVYLVPGVVKEQDAIRNLGDFRGVAAFTQGLRRFAHGVVQSRAFSSVEVVSVFSHTMEEQVRNVGFGGPIKLTKPGVDTDRFRPVTDNKVAVLRQELGIQPGKIVLVAVGRFVRAKGFMHILAALKELHGFHLLLLGDGPERELYESYAKKHHLNGRVSFVGKVFDTEKYYAAADAFVMSSTYEPLGQTILEALACDLPIIAFANSKSVNTATQELLGDNAIYADFESADGLVKTLQQFQHGFDKREVPRGQFRALAVANFSWQVLATDLLS